MVVLIKKLSNFHHKSQKPKLESIVLQSFHSTISENLFKLFSDQKNGLNYSLSLSWYIPCFKFLQGINRTFAKLVKDLDYPITKWKGKLAEDYFSHTLNMLDALNSINSLVSHVGISRLSLSHGINMITSCTLGVNLKPIVPKKIKALIFKEMLNVGSLNGGKERVIYEAMMKMRSVDMLILKVLLCGLCGEGSEEISQVNWGEFEGFNMGFGEEFVVVKEINQVNEMVKKVKSNNCEEIDELKRKLSELEDLTEIVGKEVNCLFSEVLARRNELINCFRLPKCT